MTITNMHTNHNPDDCLFCQEHLEEAAMRNLERDDQQRMEHHLARCPMCRAELTQIELSLQGLACSVEQIEPPAGAKDRLMARFETELQTPEQMHPAPILTSPSSPKPAAPPQRRFSWSYQGLAAAVAIALLMIGALNFLPINGSDGNLPDGQIEVMAMENTCPDCENGSGGQIGADPEEKDGLVMAWNLDPGRKHEVWCVNRDGHHTKVSDLRVGDTGSVMQTVSFPDAVGGYQQIYVVRDDGTQQLTVVPGNATSNSQNPETAPPPTEG